MMLGCQVLCPSSPSWINLKTFCLEVNPDCKVNPPPDFKTLQYFFDFTLEHDVDCDDDVTQMCPNIPIIKIQPTKYSSYKKLFYFLAEVDGSGTKIMKHKNTDEKLDAVFSI